MSRWFRFYSDAIRKPKVARLSDKDFRLWVELLTIASENDGLIPPLEDVKHLLNRRLDHLSSAVKRLISGSLIDSLEDGYEPHGWCKYQYKSDTSNERVKKHREKCNVTVTPPETETDTETDIDTYVSCESGDSPAILPVHLKDEWNNRVAACTGLPAIRDLTPSRQQLCKTRTKQYPLSDFQAVFDNIQRSPFLRGDRKWKGATFDWALKRENFQKILEGNYND
jgi:hypothetical protein